ncbi:MAG: aminotransferase class I/II-fold pyridoxal phosphate-dependent enzyme [Actinomycetota bacterium]
MPSSSLERIAKDLEPLMSFVQGSRYAARWGDPDIADFVFGNPHDMPLPGIARALTAHTEPHDKNWFAYKQNEPETRDVVARSLTDSHNLPFEPEDIFLTPGAFGGLSTLIRALAGPGDEVMYLSPPWFFYDAMIKVVGAQPVRIPLEDPHFAPDPALIADAITERTRAIIINTPHNPTGRIYSTDELGAVASVLQAAPSPICLISDEAYRRIVFRGERFVSPALAYERTAVVYTYGKTLLAPGERIGYIALHPRMPDREQLRGSISLSQMIGGWQFPNSTLQRAIGDLDELCIDLEGLERRRDRLATVLREIGYEVIVPAGTFYMMVRSPIEDDAAFCGALADQEVFVGPGYLFEMPGWFRLSLTANDEMVERSLPGFEKAFVSFKG